MTWITSAIYFIKKFHLEIIGLIGFILIKRNRKLFEQNKNLSNTILDHQKVIKTQNEVIHALQKNKPVGISDNIKRMRNKQL